MSKKNIVPLASGCLCLVLILLMWSCKPCNSVKDSLMRALYHPEAISNIKVINFNGGARISYMLPQNDSISYVLAKYKISEGAVREVIADCSKNTITLDGFSGSDEYEVNLYIVDKAGTRSAPVIVKVHPSSPPYLQMASSIKVKADFGGINIRLYNKFKKRMAVVLTSYDSTSKAMEIKDEHYSAAETISYSIRGLLPVPHAFGLYVVDSYGNESGTYKFALSPLPEILLDKSKFREYKLASDSEIGFNWPLTNLWDGHTDGSSDGWHTNMNIKMPAVCSFDLGVSTKLARFIIWERPDQYAYTAGNPKEFTLWGSDKTKPRDSILPLTALPGTRIGDWVNLGNFQYPAPPSGLRPPLANADDNLFIKSGVSFDFPAFGQNVRFIRVAVKNNWSGQNYAHIMEMSFYSSLK